jgi:hypothetical protein
MAGEEWDSAMDLLAGDSGYHEFANSVKHSARYIHQDPAREFISKVLAALQQRSSCLSEGQVLRRAQRGYTMVAREGVLLKSMMPHPAERMVPTVGHSTDGRVTARGIPCLYLASDVRTAVAEVRPWVGAYVSVARFQLVRQCKPVDCSARKSEKLDKEQTRLWKDISSAFSVPVSPDEPHLEYVPPQILAETFRDKGFDGIIYDSLLKIGGTNIALFDTRSAAFVDCSLLRVRNVEYAIEPCELDLIVGWDQISAKTGDSDEESEVAGGQAQ